jgi:D-3-phosphoglycerate dehydrogenase
VRIVNCARGGLIDEAALKDALDSGHVAGAALDVFVEEPAKASPLFGTPGFVATPHLGASTTEAQVNVAIQVAEQLSDYLVHGGITNALNVPALSAEEAPKLKPYMELARQLGSLVGQLEGAITGISIETEGAAAALNQKPITSAVLAGLMRVYSATVNMVNAPVLAKERGLDVREVRHDREGDYHTLLRLTVTTPSGDRSVAGTLFGNAAPRLVEIFGIRVEAELTGEMIYVVNNDQPGFIGRSARRSARRGSISAPSISAAAAPAPKRWRWFPSTSISSRSSCARWRPCRTCERSSRCDSRPGLEIDAVQPRRGSVRRRACEPP